MFLNKYNDDNEKGISSYQRARWASRKAGGVIPPALMENNVLGDE